MLRIDLSKAEAIEVRELTRGLAGEYGSTDSETLLGDLPNLVEGLPQRVIEEVRDYMGRRTSGLAVIGGHLVDEEELGPTPTEQKDPETTAASLPYEVLTTLYGSVLGTVFGWATQQSGHIVNDIIPMASMADQQVGASSKVELAWHTEDAFHPGRADFIGLLCLRNPTEAPTTVATLADVESANGGLSPTLFTDCVIIPADDAQAEGAEELGVDNWVGPSLQPVPLVRRSETGLEWCVDPAYMSVASEDPAVHEAVTDFCRTIDEQITDVVLRPGEMLLIDNGRAVHGRRPFKPTYSGRDRWLKRVNVAKEFETRAAYCTNQGRRLLA